MKEFIIYSTTTVHSRQFWVKLYDIGTVGCISIMPLPIREPYDIISCWPGSTTILQGNTPFILFTGIDAKGRQVQNLAMPKNLSDQFLEKWVKSSKNRVMPKERWLKSVN